MNILINEHINSLHLRQQNKNVPVLPYFGKFLERICANSGDPDQTAPKEQSDLGLHYLPSVVLNVS